MVKKHKERESLHIKIDPQINKELRLLIIKKHGIFYKGLLSDEINEALAHWIRLHTRTQENIHIINPPNKVSTTFSKVIQFLKEKYGYAPREVTYDDLVYCIDCVRGGDKRTIRKWLRAFIKYKLIKRISDHTFEILYSV